MQLIACSGCRRHVRGLEARCPFCGSVREPVSIENVSMSRMSRAATLAATLAIAGCQSERPVISNDPAKATPATDARVVEEPTVAPVIYGGPPPPPSVTASAPSVSPRPSSTLPAPPYGAAPPKP